MTTTTNQNGLKGLRIEYHIIQAFPVTCLNRDDVGAPKTAIIGGTTRARVSSQCWKRQVRLALREFGETMGTRTKLIKALVAEACRKIGANESSALACGEKIEHLFIKGEAVSAKSGKNDDEETEDEVAEGGRTDTLLFLSPSEVRKIAEAFKTVGFDPDKLFKQTKQDKQAKELAMTILGKPANTAIDGLDIALFGRMVAQAPEMNIEAAASFSHAISTHRVANEVEFFTALDDEQTEPGSAHMGSLEFNSATYYRYISLDLGQLSKNLGHVELEGAITAFTKALFVAVPSARQATQSGACPWAYAQVLVRRGQRLQAPFETAVKPKDGGFLEPSKAELKAWITMQEKLCGSLYGRVGSHEFGEDDKYSIDRLIGDTVAMVREARK
jgi:CRISPR system Cascade subunit CasC